MGHRCLCSGLSSGLEVLPPLWDGTLLSSLLRLSIAASYREQGRSVPLCHPATQMCASDFSVDGGRDLLLLQSPELRTLLCTSPWWLHFGFQQHQRTKSLELPVIHQGGQQGWRHGLPPSLHATHSLHCTTREHRHRQMWADIPVHSETTALVGSAAQTAMKSGRWPLHAEGHHLCFTGTQTPIISRGSSAEATHCQGGVCTHPSPP